MARRFRRTRRSTKSAEEVLTPKVERMEPKPEATVVLTVPILKAEVRKAGDDLIILIDGQEKARMDVGPVAKDLKAVGMDMLLKVVSDKGGPMASTLFRRFFGGS